MSGQPLRQRLGVAALQWVKRRAGLAVDDDRALVARCRIRRHQVRHNGPVTAGDDRLWELLRSLDDPEHLQFPPGYDHSQARSRFNQLVDRLDAAFTCACRADRHVQDASHHGSIEVPAQATATGSRLVIVVSNFGGLAVVTIDNPGTWTQAELTEALHPDDAIRTKAALEDLGYTIVPEEPLSRPYDGASRWFERFYSNENPPTWWIRFFDYL
jgi:hypothetical protein